MLISCSFNSFRIFGHYISARFQIIWRPNLWLVSCTALVSFIEFIFHPFFSPLLLHLPLFLCFLSYYHHYHLEAPDLSAPACPSFPPFILSFLHGYVLPPPYHLPGVYCCLFILLEVIFILPSSQAAIFLTWDSAEPLLSFNGSKHQSQSLKINLNESYKLTYDSSVSMY